MQCCLHAPCRQLEKRQDIKEVLRVRGYSSVWDMSEAEKRGNFFEGTGVLVLDRVNGVAYVNMSDRADADLAREWVDRMGYKVGPAEIAAYPTLCQDTSLVLPLLMQCSAGNGVHGGACTYVPQRYSFVGHAAGDVE